MATTSVYVILMMTSLSQMVLTNTNHPMRALPEVKRATSCLDFEDASREIVWNFLRQYEIEVIRLANQYLGTSVSFPVGNRKLMKAFRSLLRNREAYSEIDSLVTDITRNIQDATHDFEEGCLPMTHGKRSDTYAMFFMSPNDVI